MNKLFSCAIAAALISAPVFGVVPLVNPGPSFAPVPRLVTVSLSPNYYYNPELH